MCEIYFPKVAFSQDLWDRFKIGSLLEWFIDNQCVFSGTVTKKNEDGMYLECPLAEDHASDRISLTITDEFIQDKNRWVFTYEEGE